MIRARALLFAALLCTAHAHAAVTVRKGDTLYSLSVRHRTTVAQLRHLNGLRGDAIQIGQTLRVGTGAGPAPRARTAAPPPAAVRYLAGTALGVPVKVIEIDLTRPEVFVTPVVPARGLGTPGLFPSLAAGSGVTGLINGGYFHPTTFSLVGSLVMGGRFLSSGRLRTAVAITPDNRIRVYGPDSGPQQWLGYETVIANGPYILRGGKTVIDPHAEGYRDAAVWGRAARSAIGVRDGRHLFFLSTSARLTLGELARVMHKAGARDAIVLDGGSSTGLAWRGKTVIAPTRPIAYGVAVYADYAGPRRGRS